MNKKSFLMVLVMLLLVGFSAIRFVDSERQVNTAYNQLDKVRIHAEHEHRRRNALVTETGTVLSVANLDKTAKAMKLEIPTIEQTALNIRQ
ncbi:MAG: hypothetical protein Q4B71_02020 [Cardiobacteriaceae bacterium]|nr:hypothetical protein [Cardiobacteriaceae bacterium]